MISIVLSAPSNFLLLLDEDLAVVGRAVVGLAGVGLTLGLTFGFTFVVDFTILLITLS